MNSKNDIAMIIDSHVHFWKYNPVRDNWITDNMEEIKRDFYPQDLLPSLADSNVHGVIAVQADQSREENEFLLNLSYYYPLIKAVIGWIDLANPGIEEDLANYKDHPLMKGFRHIAENESDGFLLQKEIVKGIGLLNQYGYQYDILLRSHQLNDAVQLSEKLPYNSFILDHCGKPPFRSGDLRSWKENIRELAHNPNIYCKVSGIYTELDTNTDNKMVIEVLDFVFEHFGTERLLFGSDWPVIFLAEKYETWLAFLKSYLEKFSIRDQELFFSGNAHKFYKL